EASTRAARGPSRSMRRARRAAWTVIPSIITYDAHAGRRRGSRLTKMRGELGTVTVSARGAARVRAGHPWVFRQDVVRGPAKDARDGGPLLVEGADPRGNPL